MEGVGLKEKALFLSQYASTLWGSGVHTSRTIRNTKRIGDALGIDVKIAGFHKSLILSVIDKETDERFNVLEEIPHYPVSFEINRSLSQLSWDALDDKLSLSEISSRYAALVAKAGIHPVVVLLLASLANGAFCALFGGDGLSMAIVFFATLIGMFVKQQMVARKYNQFLTFIFCSFLASLVASVSFMFKTTSEIALATSVLFLIPGVPLINGFVDIMEGHILTGSARLINAFLLVFSIAIGLSLTIFLIKDSLL